MPLTQLCRLPRQYRDMRHIHFRVHLRVGQWFSQKTISSSDPVCLYECCALGSLIMIIIHQNNQCNLWNNSICIQAQVVLTVLILLSSGVFMCVCGVHALYVLADGFMGPIWKKWPLKANGPWDPYAACQLNTGAECGLLNICFEFN